MRKVVFFISTILLFLALSGTSTLAASSLMDIKTEETSQGIIKVKFNTGSEKKIKLKIQNGQEKYYYNLSNSDAYVNFPLQLGDGTYTISIYENTVNSKYRKLFTEKVVVKIEDEKDVFLASTQLIDWNEEDVAIQLAKKLVEDGRKKKSVKLGNKWVQLTEEETIDILYQYVVKNIQYDYEKIKTLEYDYKPTIDSTLETGTGICYDYASLLASMLRSQGIATKLIKGYTTWTSVYHAWNEVYLSTEDRWVIVDTTYDAYKYAHNRAYTFEKDREVYKTSKEF